MLAILQGAAGIWLAWGPATEDNLHAVIEAAVGLCVVLVGWCEYHKQEAQQFVVIQPRNPRKFYVENINTFLANDLD